MKIRRPTIIEWLRHAEYIDNRGWKEGCKRKYSPKEEKKICVLKLERNKLRYFVGGEYVQMDYAQSYPGNLIPSVWFIEETVRKHNLQTAKPKKKKKGGSEYLLYPAEAIKRLGTIQQSADFIGKKYIDNHSEPINIFSTTYYCPFKLYQIQRVLAQKTAFIFPILTTLWQRYPIPDVFRIDNGLQFRGSGSGKRFLSPFLNFILNLNIIPLFGSPNKPWTNPHIEGHNKVFGDKVWGKNRFTNLKQIDKECQRFNQESVDLFDFKYQDCIKYLKQKRFLTKQSKINFTTLRTRENKKLYFIRFVEHKDGKNNSFIIILNEKVIIPQQYDHQFVLVECNIEKNRLYIFSEYQRKVTKIHQVKFKINL